MSSTTSDTLCGPPTLLERSSCPRTARRSAARYQGPLTAPAPSPVVCGMWYVAEYVARSVEGDPVKRAQGIAGDDDRMPRLNVVTRRSAYRAWSCTCSRNARSMGSGKNAQIERLVFTASLTFTSVLSLAKQSTPLVCIYNRTTNTSPSQRLLALRQISAKWEAPLCRFHCARLALNAPMPSAT